VALDRERSRYYSTRPRRVPPEFCTDELLESCSPTAALLIYRLISQADDQGRLQGSAKRVRATCFPMRPEITERKVTDAITELVEAGFVIRYEINARTYVQIDHWTDLQGRWGRRAYPSRHPAPPGWTGDWESVKADEGADPAVDSAAAVSEVRAPDTQPASKVHTPNPITPPFSSSIPSPGPSSPARGARAWGSAGEVLLTAMESARPQETRPTSRIAIPRNPR